MAKCKQINYSYINKVGLKQSGSLLLNEQDSRDLQNEAEGLDFLLKVMTKAIEDPDHYLSVDVNNLLELINSGRLINTQFSYVKDDIDEEPTVIAIAGEDSFVNTRYTAEELTLALKKDELKSFSKPSKQLLLSLLEHPILQDAPLKVIFTSGYPSIQNGQLVIVDELSSDSGLGFYKAEDSLLVVHSPNTEDVNRETMSSLIHETIHHIVENTEESGIKKEGEKVLKEVKKELSKTLTGVKYLPVIGNSVSELITYLNSEPDLLFNLSSDLQDSVIGLSVKVLNIKPKDLRAFLKEIHTGTFNANKPVQKASNQEELELFNREINGIGNLATAMSFVVAEVSSKHPAFYPIDKLHELYGGQEYEDTIKQYVEKLRKYKSELNLDAKHPELEFMYRKLVELGYDNSYFSDYEDPAPFRRKLNTSVFQNWTFKPFSKRPAYDVDTKTGLIKVSQKTELEIAAKEIREAFESSVPVYNTGKKNVKNYDVAYGPYQTLKTDEDEKPLLRAYQLKQGDIIRYTLQELDKKSNKWVDNKKGATTYAPLIYSSVWNGEDGKELHFSIVNSKGNVQHIPVSRVMGYRENFGILKDGDELKPIANDDQIKIYEDFKKNKHWNEKTKRWDIPEDSIFKSITLKGKKGNEFEIYTTKNNEGTYVSFNKDNEFDNYDDSLFHDLKEGDAIKSFYYDYTKKDKDDAPVKVYYWAPVIRSLANAIQTVIDTDEGYMTKYIPKKYIRGAYMKNSNHKDLLDTAQSKLQEIEEMGGFYNIPGFKREHFIRYTADGELHPKPSFKDLYSIMTDIKDEDGSFEDYKEWRKKQGDVLKKRDEYKGLDQLYRDYSAALTSRDITTSRMGFGSYVILDRPAMMKDSKGEWIENPSGKTQFSPAFVVSKNGNWLNVLVYQTNFDDNGKPIKGTGKIYPKKVNIYESAASVKDGKMVYAIRSVLYDNRDHVQLIDKFKDIKESFEKNFTNKQRYFKLIKEGSPIPKDLYYLSVAAQRDLKEQAEDIDIVYNRAATKLAERYDLRVFDEDLAEEDRLRYISFVKRGSVVLVQSNKDNIPYMSNIVVDVDSNTGSPLVGFVNPRTNEYTVVPVDLNEIVGVGYDLYGQPDLYQGPGEEHLRITPDTYHENKRKRYLSDFRFHKQRTYYASKKEAESYVQEKLKKMSAKGKTSFEGKLTYLEYYQDPETKSRKLATKEQSDKGKNISYVPVLEKVIKGSKGEFSRYRDVNESPYWYEIFSLNAMKREDLWSVLEVGDIFSRSYEATKGDYDGRKFYNDYMIIEKNDNMIIGRTFYVDKNGVDGFNDHYIFKSKDAFGLGEGIYHVDLHYVGRNAEINKKLAKFKEDGAKEGYVSSAGEDRTSTKKSGLTKGRSKSNTAKPETEVIKRTNTRGTVFSKTSNIKSSPTELIRLKSFGDRLEAIYGNKISYLNSDDILRQYPNVGDLRANQRAFIDEEGNIVINTDFASLAEPIHEFGHLVMDGLKRLDPETYSELLKVTRSHKDYAEYASLYPELTGTQLEEEIFLTVMGEYFNEKVSTIATDKFIEDNQSFIMKWLGKLKKFIGDLLGIVDDRYYTLEPGLIATMSINQVLDKFSSGIINGEYLTAFEIGQMKQNLVQNGKYLVDNDGNVSTLYSNLLAAGYPKYEAATIWTKTKSANFAEWAGTDLLRSSNKEPMLHYKRSDGNISEIFEPESIPVFVKKSIDNEEISLIQTRPVVTADIKMKLERDLFDIDQKAVDLNLPMIGEIEELQNTIKELKKIYPDHTFVTSSIANTFYVDFYQSYSKKVQDLRKKLLNNNTLKLIC